MILGPKSHIPLAVSKNNTLCKWVPPASRFKLNVDGSFDPTTKKGGTGCVIRDSNDEWIAGKNTKITTNSALTVELIALMHGLWLAQRLNITNITITRDSMEVINMLEI